MIRGDVLASAAFCAAIHNTVCALDSKLSVVGVAARSDMDDGYAVGPPTLVLEAVVEFTAAVQELGLGHSTVWILAATRTGQTSCQSVARSRATAVLDMGHWWVTCLSVLPHTYRRLRSGRR